MDDLQDLIDKRVQVINAGEGPVRVRVSMGISFEGVPDVWLKPGYDIEVPVPEHCLYNDVEFLAYQERVLSFAEGRLLHVLLRLVKLAGLTPVRKQLKRIARAARAIQESGYGE